MSFPEQQGKLKRDITCFGLLYEVLAVGEIYLVQPMLINHWGCRPASSFQDLSRSVFTENRAVLLSQSSIYVL